MNSTSSNNRTTLTNTIRNTQQLHKRFNRRFNASKNPSERTFLKQEINACCATLKKCATQWKNAGYGSTIWVTRGYSPCTLSATGHWKNVPGTRVTGYSKKSRNSRESRKSNRKSTRTHSSRKNRTSARKSRRNAFSSRSSRRAFSFAY